MYAIELQDVTRRYGKRTAVDHLTLAIHPGEVFGFVGPNGAGKTSTIRMIAGLLQITSGEILVGGHSVRRRDPRRPAARSATCPITSAFTPT